MLQRGGNDRSGERDRGNAPQELTFLHHVKQELPVIVFLVIIDAASHDFPKGHIVDELIRGVDLTAAVPVVHTLASV